MACVGQHESEVWVLLNIVGTVVHGSLYDTILIEGNYLPSAEHGRQTFSHIKDCLT